MASFNWAADVSGDWNTGTLWTPTSVPNTATADVTIDATATLAPYTVAIASGETETVDSLSMNGTNNFYGTEIPGNYVAAELELDGTLVFAAGSAGAFGGSLQTYVHEGSGSSAAIVNGGTLNAFIQAEGTLLLTGNNSVYISNELEALGGTVTIAAPIGNVAGNTLIDGIFNATGQGAVIDLGSASAGQIVNIATVAAPFGWAELTFDGPAAAIDEWTVAGLVPVETTLRVIGSGGTVDILGGRNYIGNASLTIDETNGSSFFGRAMLNLQAGTVAIAGGININDGVVQGYGTIASPIVNNGTVIALGGTVNGTLDVTGSLTGTGIVAFDLNASTGGDPTEATLLLNSVAAGQTITLNDGGDTLILATPAAFAGTIVAGMGGRIILQGMTAASALLNQGTLLVRNGGSQTVASLALAGSYAGDSFMASGSIVTIVATPTISGTVARQAISDQGTITPFAGVRITDSNFAQTETVTVTLTATSGLAAANGKLTNPAAGSYNGTTGVYTVTGTPSAVTAALAGLVFVPTPQQINPGLTVTTGFTIHDTDIASKSATDSTTTVITTTGTVLPAISGALANQQVSDQGTIAPFASIVIADANYGQTEQVTVQLIMPGDGTLSNCGAGSYGAADGSYHVSGTALAVMSALRGLVFTPTPHEVAPGQTVATDFVVTDTDTAKQFALDRATTVITTEGTVQPTISGMLLAQPVSDQATIAPFAQVVIADANLDQYETVTVTPTIGVANGALTNVDAFTYDPLTGAYTITNVASVVTSLVNALVFTPTLHQVAPGQTVTTEFTVSDIDSASATATPRTTTVITMAGTAQPTISAGGPGQMILDQGTILPFDDVAIADANFGQIETVTVTLSDPANGTLIDQGQGTYDVGAGVYCVAGTTAQVTNVLNALVFTPTPHQIAPGGTIATSFTIRDVDTASASAIDTTRTVYAVADYSYPTITGAVTNPTISDQQPITPFASVAIGDLNFGQVETVTVTMLTPGNGTLINLDGTYDPTLGIYTITNTAPLVSAALDGLVFSPAQHLAPPGTNVTTLFRIDDIDSAGQMATDITTTVSSTVTAVPPTISGTEAVQSVSDQSTLTPFAGVQIADANHGQTETVTVTLSSAANGTLINLNTGTYAEGVYTFILSPYVVNEILNGLVFVPTPNQATPAQPVTTIFTIGDTDAAGQTAIESTTTVIVTAELPPTISGSVAEQAVSDLTTISPFASITIADANPGQTETVTVSLSPPANGTLTNLGAGAYNPQSGTYSVTGSADAVTAALNGWIFAPTPHQVAPGQSITTDFEISDTDTAGQTAIESTTTVVATATAVPLTINGTSGEQMTSDQAAISPFANVVVADPNFGQTETLTVTPSAANGTFANLGIGNCNAAGVYTVIGTSIAVTTALEGLAFAPTPHQVSPGNAATTIFTISDTDAASQTAIDSTTTVIATAIPVLPAIDGTEAGQATSDQATISPFASVVIADSNFNQTETVKVTLSAPGDGTLTNLGGGSYNTQTGVYSVTGSAAVATAALAELVFMPADHQVAPGQTVTTDFTISDTDSASQTATDSTTSVIATAGTVVPTISGTLARQAVSDLATIAPFAHVMIADANFGQTETVTVTLSATANGTLTDTVAGSYVAGTYTDIGTSTEVTTALNALLFVPARAEVAGGRRVTTGFSLRVTDTAGASTSDTATTVVTTAVIAPPGEVILSGSSSQYVIADENGSLYLQGTVAARNETQILSGVTVMAFTDGVGVFDPTGTAEDVARLYKAAFHRAPDVGGLEYWTGEVDDFNVPLSVAAGGFAASPEFVQTYGQLTDEKFVQQLYQNVLGRGADATGSAYWDGVLASGVTRGSVLLGFSESPEFKSDMVSVAGDQSNAEAYRLYAAAFNRVPDPGGQEYWASQLANGATPTQVAQGFVGSTEFIQEYGTLSAGDFVADLYWNVLHRAGDPVGQRYWTNILQQGGSEASVLVGFSDSIENRAQTASATHANWVFIPA